VDAFFCGIFIDKTELLWHFGVITLALRMVKVVRGWKKKNGLGFFGKSHR
jgi:hypothetical protein